MRTFIKNYLHFIKNCIRPPVKKLKSLKSGFIKNSNFENNRVPCTLALALPKDHNPVNTTFFDKKDKNTKKTKKTQKDKKVISGDLVLMKYVKDPTIRHQIKLIFPSYFNLYSIKCSSSLSSC